MEMESKAYDAITYKDLFLSSVDMVYIRKLDIVQSPGFHASLYLEAVLDEQDPVEGWMNRTTPWRAG